MAKKDSKAIIIIIILAIIGFIALKGNFSFIGSTLGVEGLAIENNDAVDSSSYVNQVKKLEQSFIAPTDMLITKLNLKLSGSEAIVRIVSSPLGDNVLYSTTVLGLSPDLQTTTIAIPNIEITAGSTYGIELSTESTTWTYVGLVDPSTYAGKYWWYHADTGWTEITNRDFWFELYGKEILPDSNIECIGLECENIHNEVDCINMGCTWTPTQSEYCSQETGTLCDPLSKIKQTYTDGCQKDDLLSQGYVTDLLLCEEEQNNNQNPVTCWAYSTSGCASFTTYNCTGEYFATEEECNSFTSCPEFVKNVPTYIGMEADCNAGVIIIAIAAVALLLLLLIIF